jgi:glycosyltransferase involved in cell wall biosynthesis
MSIEFSIIMPSLNEAEMLEKCVLKARSFLERSGVSGEIVTGDNGSTDGSQEIARRLGARVVDIPVREYGVAIYGARQILRHGRFR